MPNKSEGKSENKLPLRHHIRSRCLHYSCGRSGTTFPATSPQNHFVMAVVFPDRLLP